MGSLKLQSVRKSFGDFEAIKGVDLDISDGEFVVFVGPSGCGNPLCCESSRGWRSTRMAMC